MLALAAAIGGPYGIARDAAGNIFVTNTVSPRVFKINTSGILTTVAGNGAYGYTGDGGPATQAELQAPYGVAVDGFGDIFIADQLGVIREVNATTGIISTVAGNGVPGYPAMVARESRPSSTDLDAFSSTGQITSSLPIRTTM